MNIVANFEHGASSSRGKHKGESSFALCDRLSRTRDNSQRQLPTDHDYAVPTREYQTDQSSLKHRSLNIGVTIVSNAQKYYSMLRYNRSIGAIQNSNVFVSPHIVEFDRCLQIHLTHLQRHWRLQFSTVE